MIHRLMPACLLVTAVAAGLAAEPAVSPVVLPRAEQFDLKSKAGLDYRIYIAAPPMKPPETGHPVIYLTDGNGNFPILLAAARRQEPGNTTAAVIVGIGYPSDDARTHSERRTYDLTSPASHAWLEIQPKLPKGAKTGGHDEFLAFIEDELKPVVERKHAIDRSRQTLFGHSLGGLFVLHTLFSKPQAFRNYVASSPSIWWNDRSILADEMAFAEKHAGKPVEARLLVTVGEFEQKPPAGTPEERAATLTRLRMVDNARELADRVGKLGVKSTFRELAEEDHGSALLPAAGRGVRFALSTAEKKGK